MKYVLNPNINWTKESLKGQVVTIVDTDAKMYGDDDPMYLVRLKDGSLLYINSDEIIPYDVYKSKLYKVLA